MTGSGRMGPTIAAGALAGAVLGAALWWVVAGSNEPAATTDPDTVSTGTSPPAEVVWFDSDETVLGPAVLIPISLETAGEELVFDFDLQNLSPLSDIDGHGVMSVPGNIENFDPATATVVVPDAWTLVTADREIPFRPTSPTSRSARFRVPAGFSVSEVESIRLDSWRLAVPFSFPLAISPDDEGAHEIAPGLTAAIATVLEQSDGWLIVVELNAAPGIDAADLAVEGVGPEWTRATGSLLGTPRWTMEYRAEDLPDTLTLEARGLWWARIAGPVGIDLGAVRR